MKYYPTTDEYFRNYFVNGGISPNNVTGVVWKPDRYDFPFEPGPEVTANSAIGSNNNNHIDASYRSYIRIKHIYNFKVAPGVTSIGRSHIWPSPSSQYNSDVPEAYTMGNPVSNPVINKDVITTYRRATDNVSYVDPPIITDLTARMAKYTGVLFTYSEGIKWTYDKDRHVYVKTDIQVNGYRRRLFYPGLNEYSVTLSSEDGSSTRTGRVRVWIGKRDGGGPTIAGNWVYQDSFRHIRPVRDDQNYQNRYGLFPYQDDHGRGQYVQFYAMETFYDPKKSTASNSATNIWDNNYGNPNFIFPDEETPLYQFRFLDGGQLLNDSTHLDDHFYPTKDAAYVLKIHENSMRNAGYMDADYTPYQSQYGLWYEVDTLTVQGTESVDSTGAAVKLVVRTGEYNSLLGL